MQMNVNKKDNAWKQIIEQYFPKLIEFIIPNFITRLIGRVVIRI
jgi:hypothetical protein